MSGYMLEVVGLVLYWEKVSKTDSIDAVSCDLIVLVSERAEKWFSDCMDKIVCLPVPNRGWVRWHANLSGKSDRM